MEKYPSDLRDRLMDQQTSIRTEIPCPDGGRILTLGFPGLAFDVRGEAYIDRDRMEATLAACQLKASRLLVVLVERHEVPEEGWTLLDEIAEANAIELVHLPISDYGVPDDAFMTRWRALQGTMETILSADQSVALACHYGAGRSGTIAAYMLIGRGLGAAAAIAAIRSRFPDSVESENQVTWLNRQAAATP